MERQQRDASFKAGAVALAEQLGSVPDAAKQLGVTESSIYRWRNQVVKAKPKTKAKAKPKKKPKRRPSEPIRLTPADIHSMMLPCPMCGAPTQLRYINGGA